MTQEQTAKGQHDNTDVQAFTKSLESGAFEAFLFDLDGVITPTSDLHKRAWQMLFEPVLKNYGVSPYTEQDYFDFIDGRPRIDGVRSLLAARGISIPDGGHSMSEHKNDMFNQILSEEGIHAYVGTQAFLDYLNRFPRIALAVVSSSKNAEQILEMAGLRSYFTVIVDGTVATAEGMPGKPAPDTFLRAAELLGTTPERSVVFEDATSGVQAGAAGAFAWTIGVNRGAGRSDLLKAGATLVVDDLAELVPQESQS